MKTTIIIAALLAAILSLPVMAVDYFANGCMVWDHRGKMVQTAPGEFTFKSTVHCHQFIIKTERGKKLEGWH